MCVTVVRDQLITVVWFYQRYYGTFITHTAMGKKRGKKSIARLSFTTHIFTSTQVCLGTRMKVNKHHFRAIYVKMVSLLCNELQKSISTVGKLMRAQTCNDVWKSPCWSEVKHGPSMAGDICSQLSFLIWPAELKEILIVNCNRY